MWTMRPSAVGVKPMIELTATAFDHPITVTAIRAGNDWNIFLAGGCAPHVGSVSLAEYSNDSVILRSLLRETHKDQIIGDHFARVLAEHKKCTVCVSCGIHYDGPDANQLAEIVSVSKKLLSNLIQTIDDT